MLKKKSIVTSIHKLSDNYDFSKFWKLHKPYEVNHTCDEETERMATKLYDMYLYDTLYNNEIFSEINSIFSQKFLLKILIFHKL